MVLPEGTRESEGNRPKTVIAIGAAFLLVLATVALGLATAPGEESAPEAATTTTSDESLQLPTTTVEPEAFSVSDIATGERLSWRQAPPLGSGSPIELLGHNNQIFLFTSEPGTALWGTPRGMEVWVSDNGVQWDRIGGLEGSHYAVAGVASVGKDLIALGYRIEDGSPHVWVSPEGVEWRASELPPAEFDPDQFPATINLTDAALLDDRLIVVGTAYVDPMRTIIEHLPSEFADLAGRYGIGLSEGPEGRVIQVHAPLGIIGYSATLEELGVPEETADRFFHGPSTEQSFIWTSTDGNDWSVAELGELFVGDLWAQADGTLMASGWSNSGPRVWSSPDGLSWEPVDRSSVMVADSWNGTLIGSRHGWDLVRSTDGSEWESLGTSELLPLALDWNLHPIDIGEAGIAAIATTWVEQAPRLRSPTTIEIDGHILEIDHGSGVLTVKEGVSEVLRVLLWDDTANDAVTVDFATETVTFLSPDSTEEILTVDFATLVEAEMASYNPNNGERALLLGDSDGEWSILDLSEELGDQEWVAMMRMLGDRLVLVTYEAPWVTGQVPEVSIRVANLR